MLYQKQFVEMLAAEYGSREQFLDEFNIDIFRYLVDLLNGDPIDFTEAPRPMRMSTAEIPFFYEESPMRR